MPLPTLNPTALSCNGDCRVTLGNGAEFQVSSVPVEGIPWLRRVPVSASDYNHRNVAEPAPEAERPVRAAESSLVPVGRWGTGPIDLEKVGQFASDVEMEPIQWLWSGYLARGKLHVIDGDPEASKSTLTLDLAARLSTGAPWPDGASNGSPAVSVIISAEDDPADTTCPRLVAAGADMSRILLMDARIQEQLLTFPTHIEVVERKLTAIGARFLVIDPFTAFLDPEFDSNKEQHVRYVLLQLADLAKRAGVAVVAIRHLNKKVDVKNPAYRGLGSIGITAAARITYLVAPDKNDPDRRIMAAIKCNVARKPPALAYRLETVEVETPKGVAEVGRIVWEETPANMTANELLEEPGSSGESRLTEATEFLGDLLRDEPQPSELVAEKARKLGISEATLRRAAARLNVKRTKRRTDGKWYMCLPALNGEDAHLGGEMDEQVEQLEVSA
jgi:AAA domain